jgi:hypothetical protein
MGSDDFGVAHQDGHNLIQVGDSFKNVVFEDSGELMFDGGEQCDEVEGVHFQISA